MSLCAQLLRATCRVISVPPVRKSSAAVEPAARTTDEPPQNFRTLENNPVNHTSEHLHRFYTVPNEAREQLYRSDSLTKTFQKQVETFAELTILVRSPAVELISHLRRTDYSRPANKYVLYGELGTGKSIALAHVLHYAATTKHILVHVPWAPRWFRYPKEIAASRTREGYIDLPVDGAAWLVHFKHQNSKLLSELDIRVSKDYEWSSRESTKSGAPLMELIDLGISRLKYACDVIYALTVELKLASTAGKCTTLVAIDGFNAFYAQTSRIKNDNRKTVLPIKVSLTEAFLNITKYDWCNGAIVVTVDPIAAMNGEWSGLPRYLLGKEGFEHLDPFLPIMLDNYTPEEYDSVIEYYKERKWIRNITKDGQRELELLSARNPYYVMHYSASLYGNNFIIKYREAKEEPGICQTRDWCERPMRGLYVSQNLIDICFD